MLSSEHWLEKTWYIFLEAGREKVSTESPCSLFCSRERLPQLNNQSDWASFDPWQTVRPPALGIEPALQCKMDVLALKDNCFFKMCFTAPARGGKHLLGLYRLLTLAS